jgi:hypothetical protein
MKFESRATGMTSSYLITLMVSLFCNYLVASGFKVQAKISTSLSSYSFALNSVKWARRLD